MPRSIFLLYLAALVFVLNGCANTVITAKDIEGEWKVVSFEADMENISPIVLKNAEKIALSTRYEFKSDGNFKRTDNFSSAKGTWEFRTERQELVLIHESYAPQIWTYLGDHQFELVEDEGVGTSTTVIEKI